MQAGKRVRDKPLINKLTDIQKEEEKMRLMNSEYLRGYRDGYNSELPNSGIFGRQKYFDGYAKGSIDRDRDRVINTKVIVARQRYIVK